MTHTNAATCTQGKHTIRYLNFEGVHSIYLLSLLFTHGVLNYTYKSVHTHTHTSQPPDIHAAIARPLGPHSPPSSSYGVCSSWIHSVCLSSWTDGPVSVVQLWRLAPEIQPVSDFHDGSCPRTVSRS